MNNVNKKIVLTGGGTAGHVTPNIALLPQLKKKGYKIDYIGSHEGIERGLINLCDIPYHAIASGKLRRYVDLKNVTDLFRIVKGLADAIKTLRQIKPDVVFSKGGFVVVPVVIAAKLLNIPVVIHESDITPGLANKIAIPFAKVVCTAFPETLSHIPNGKGVYTGTPIREFLWNGNAQKGAKICGFIDPKPIIMIMGGSQGAVAVNNAITEILPKLQNEFNIIHLCGKGNIKINDKKANPGYAPFEYAQEDLPHMLAAADIVVSRAGANSIFELLALKKPNLLIPLSRGSRGDQILNAASFEKQGYSKVMQEDDITGEKLHATLQQLYEEREKYTAKMDVNKKGEGVAKIIEQIERWTKDIMA